MIPDLQSLPSCSRWFRILTLASLAISLLPANAPLSAADQPPVSVVCLGDSVMRVLSHSLEREFTKHPDYTIFSFTSLGSGLARLDMFDWMGKIAEITRDKKPAIVIMIIGANDKQPMQIQDAAVVQPGTAEWKTEYARRVGAAMDLMITGGVQRIFWAELPDMREAKLQEDTTQINQIIEQAAATRPAVTYIRTRTLLSRKPGVFSPYILQSNGLPLQVRDADGIHMNRDGADLLARQIVSQILKTSPATAP